MSTTHDAGKEVVVVPGVDGRQVSHDRVALRLRVVPGQRGGVAGRRGHAVAARVVRQPARSAVVRWGRHVHVGYYRHG